MRSVSSLRGVVFGATLGFLALPGCLGTQQELVSDEEGVSTDDVSLASSAGLLGAWERVDGAFTGLVFTSTRERTGRHFFADVDTGIRCITTPCPSAAHLEGYFTAGSRTFTLRHPDRPSPEAAPFYARYDYTLQRDVLTVSQNRRVVGRLRRVPSYCSHEDQCAEQHLVTPRCVGYFTCTEENRCRYRCGQRDCSNTTCAPGEMCQMEGGAPLCITRCATVRCSAGTTCVADADGARCVSDGTQRCGSATCAAGTTCCNPLRGLCVRPGMVCIQ
ncbi:MAG: hypothetical protein R3A52_27590 [Polyangiales bacterium]